MLWAPVVKLKALISYNPDLFAFASTVVMDRVLVGDG